jgi:hypothetical protein
MREAERRDLPQPVPLFWRTEGGRVICRDTATGRVLAGIGPDGYARGEAAAQGEPFANPGPSVALGRHTADGWHGAGLAILDDGRRIVALLVPATPAAAVPKDSVEPLEIVVETRPVSDGMVDWTESPWVARTGDEIQILLTTGARIGRVRLDEGESIISTAGDREMSGKRLVARPPPQSVGIATALMPGHPATKRIRLRLFRPLMPMAQHDVLLEPMRPSESIPANFAAALALLRPLPLNVAASLSPLPKDPAESFRWWWRDPWLADGSYAGWLFASAALAALLALRARRVARERCATAREVRLWTAAVFLLGPVGLLWMRLVLPRVPVERVGAARRAVNLDASPSASAPWPEPARDGIEVFG